MITKSKEKVDGQEAKEVPSSTSDSFNNNTKNMEWLMADAVDDIYALEDE